MIRPIYEIGNLWPLCNICKHMAQSHDFYYLNKNTFNGCCAITIKDKKCKCNGYVGPSLEEFKRNYLTQEEINYYDY